VANVLKREGIEPAPTRGTRTPWSMFLKAHWRALVAADFLSVEVWKLNGLITYYVLFLIELPTRAVTIAGITPNPAEAWMLQVARNVCDVEDGVLRQGGTLIVDRDAKYSNDWRCFIEAQGVEVIRLPPRSPNLNAYAERFVRTIKSECLDRMIFIGEASLRRAVAQLMAHYHVEESPGLGQSAHPSRAARSSIAWRR
jgi:transposase InsO family protein